VVVAWSYKPLGESLTEGEHVALWLALAHALAVGSGDAEHVTLGSGSPWATASRSPTR
jgi:hypothetical protein